MKLPRWNRNFRLYFFGCLASRLGGALSSFCTGLFFLDMTGSAALMSAYLAWTMVLGLALKPMMGAVCDRLPKVRVMWSCDFLFSATDLIAAALLFGGLNGAPAAAVVFANGTVNCLVGTLFEPASASLPPMIVEKDRLTNAYSALSAMEGAINLFGVVFAAALYGALGYAWILLVNGLCVGLSGLAESRIRVPERPAEFRPGHVWRDWLEGLRYLRGKRPLLAVVGIAVPVNFFFNGFVSVALPFIIRAEFGLPATALAACEAGMALGGIAMALVLSARSGVRPGRAVRMGLGQSALEGVALCAVYALYRAGHMPTAAFVATMAGMFALMGASVALNNLPMQAALAAQVSPEYMARVLSLFGTLCGVAAPLGVMSYGALVDGAGAFAAAILTVAGVAACAAYAMLNRAIDELG